MKLVNRESNFPHTCLTLHHITIYQIKSLLLSHHHSTSALVSEILMSVLQTVQKNNRQFTYGQTVQKKQQTIYIWTDSAKKQQTIYIWTDSAKKQQTIYIWTDSAKKLHWSIYSAPDSAKKTTAIYIWTDSAKKLHWSIYSAPDSAKKNNSNLHMDRQCKKTTAIYIWTVHIYRLYRRQCAKYTYMYSVRLVYYKDILNYQQHIIHRMGTSTLCTVSIHNVVYT